MDQNTNVPSDSNKHTNHQISISTNVNYALLIIGLVAEFFGIFNLDGFRSIKGPEYWIVFICLIFMLIHQFMTIRNFHLIDHITNNDENNPLGSWVRNNKIEHLIRYVIFIFLSCLTGEMAYLLIVTSESIDIIKRHFDIHSLTWIRPLYLISALSITFFMFLWAFLGFLHEYKFEKIKLFGPLERKYSIVFYPFNVPYFTFMASDFITFFLWILMNFIAKGDTTKTVWVGLLVLVYVILIGSRVIAEIKINLPKIIERYKIIKGDTVWWKEKIKDDKDDVQYKIAYDFNDTSKPIFVSLYKKYFYNLILAIFIGLMTSVLLTYSVKVLRSYYSERTKASKTKMQLHLQAIKYDSMANIIFINGYNDSALIYYILANKYEEGIGDNGYDSFIKRSKAYQINNDPDRIKMLGRALKIDSTRDEAINLLKK